MGPVLFNIYVSNLPSCIKSDSIQYADDTTIYKFCKKTHTTVTAHQLEAGISNLSQWSSSNGLLFNNEKLKFITFSKKSDQVTNRSILIKSAGKSIQEESSVKLLGVIFDRHLTWSEQINSVVKSTYGILRTLKTFKRCTPFKVRKSLAESLVLSRINYCNVVYGQLPLYLLKRLQRVQNCAAGYVFGRCGKIEDVIKLHWLPIRENINYNIARLTF